MKHLVIFLFALIVLCFSFPQLEMFKTTSSGERIQSFKSAKTLELPQVLRDYLANNNIRYEYYKIPNYVKDFFMKNKDFSVIYNSKNKYTVILFAPVNEASKYYQGFGLFQSSLKKELKEYNESFNIIYKYQMSDKVVYENKYDNKAFKDLELYCKCFCFINPSNDTLFTFKNITQSEAKALEVLFQQYSFELK